MANKNTPTSGTKRLPFLENKRLQIAIISLFTLFLYSGIVSYQFIGLDEPTLIIDNYSFLKDPSNIPQAFKQHVFYAKHHTENPRDYYRPVLTLSFLLDAQFSNKPSPKFFHFSNIIYHIISCVLLFILFHRLRIDPLATFLFSLVFAAHPLLTQAVAWIPGRNDSLITIFCLLSFINLVKYAETGSVKNVILHLLLFFVALLTKESAMALTAISFLFLLIISHEKLLSLKSIYLFSGYLIVISAWYFMRFHAFEGMPNQATLKSPFKELLINSPLLLQYIQKMVLPFNLSVMSTVGDTNYILAGFALLLLAVGIYFTKQKRWNYILFGFVWFLAFISPSLLTGYFGGLEHRTYLSMVGIFIVVSEFDIFKREAIRKYKYLVPAILVLFTGFTIYRLPVFNNAISYWESAVKTSDHSSLACLNLGKTYESIGQYQKAIDAYREGLKRNPKERLLHNNIGAAFIYLRNYEQAELEIKKEIELFPDNYMAYFNLGIVKERINKNEEAAAYWKKSLEYNKNFVNAYQQLAQYYKSINDTVNFKRCVEEVNRTSRL